MRPFRLSDTAFAPRLAALYAAIFVMAGIQLPFFPVWLKAKGLDAQMIGLVLAIPMIVRVFAIPVATCAADRHDALRASIMVACAASIAGYALTGAAAGALAILVAYALASLAFTPVMPLTETYALRGLSLRGKAYRAGAAVGLARVHRRQFCRGLCRRHHAGARTDLAHRRGDRDHGACVLRAGAGGAGGDAGGAASAAQDAAARPRLCRRARGGKPDPGKPCRLLRLLGAGLARARPRRHRDRRVVVTRRHRRDRAVCGSARLPAWLSRRSADADRRRRRGLALDGDGVRSAGAALPWLQLLHALSFGATISARSISSRARRRRGKARPRKAISPSPSGVAMAAATGVSGLLYAAFGARAYAAMALAAVAGGVCAFVADERGVAMPLSAHAPDAALSQAATMPLQIAALHVDHPARQPAVMIDPAPHSPG